VVAQTSTGPALDRPVDGSPATLGLITESGSRRRAHRFMAGLEAFFVRAYITVKMSLKHYSKCTLLAPTLMECKCLQSTREWEGSWI
jgi:hypothetical protein